MKEQAYDPDSGSLVTGIHGDGLVWVTGCAQSQKILFGPFVGIVMVLYAVFSVVFLIGVAFWTFVLGFAMISMLLDPWL